MNEITLTEAPAGTPLAIDAKPTPLRLPKGSAIFAARGEVWITQEGMYDDVVLAPGERFDVKDRALILASATRGSAYLIVVRPAHAAARADRDFVSFVKGRARHLRTELLSRAMQSVWRLVCGHPAASADVRRMPAQLGHETGH